MRIFFLTALLSFSSYAFELKIDRYKVEPEREGSIELFTNLKERSFIDCQSFIQGLRVGEFEESVFFLLNPYECTDLQARVIKSIKRRKSHCIELASEIISDKTCGE